MRGQPHSGYRVDSSRASTKGDGAAHRRAATPGVSGARQQEAIESHLECSLPTVQRKHRGGVGSGLVDGRDEFGTLGEPDFHHQDPGGAARMPRRLGRRVCAPSNSRSGVAARSAGAPQGIRARNTYTQRASAEAGSCVLRFESYGG